MLGRILWDAFPDTRDTGLGQMFRQVMARREAIRSETKSVVFKGRWMAYRLFPLGDGLGAVFRDTTDRKRAEEQRDLLINEMEHRVKNTLTTVQSIASQSFRAAGIEPEALRAFDARLIALGNVHSVLTRQSWDAANLDDVVRSALRPHNPPGRERFSIEGPALEVGPKCAVAFSMAVHELATNAIKYGALSSDAGHVHITWSAVDDRFRWAWRERGGPPVVVPSQTGFGSRMIERALALQLSGKVAIDYRPSGLVCTIDAPLAAIHDTLV